MKIGEILSVHGREEWREWLHAHHAERKEIWLLFFKKNSGRPTPVEYEAAVEEALCYGWIDGMVQSVDDASYALRFTPRKRRSTWSESNRTRVRRLLERGLMQPAGLAVLPPDLSPAGSGETAGSGPRDPE